MKRLDEMKCAILQNNPENSNRYHTARIEIGNQDFSHGNTTYVAC